MTPTEFQAWAVANWSRGKRPSKLRSLAIMSLGIGGEAGEVQDMLKKHIRTGKPMDTRKLKLELGDLLYYVVRTAAEYGIKFDDVMISNRRKIMARNRRNAAWRTEKNT
jgi:NTP pyrophosphatase (non-canonical NTP hydrolase)